MANVKCCFSVDGSTAVNKSMLCCAVEEINRVRKDRITYHLAITPEK